MSLFVFLCCISLRRLLDAVPHITPLSSRLLIEIGATLQEEVVGMELRGPVLGTQPTHANTGLEDHVCEWGYNVAIALLSSQCHQAPMKIR